jgi:hypothetical protein
VLTDCLAWFDCRVFARYDAGDRLYFWGDIVAGTLRVPSDEVAGTLRVPSDKVAGTLRVPPEADDRQSLPATCLREHAFFASLTDEQRGILAADRQADAARNQPRFEIWRSTRPW